MENQTVVFQVDQPRYSAGQVATFPYGESVRLVNQQVPATHGRPATTIARLATTEELERHARERSERQKTPEKTPKVRIRFLKEMGPYSPSGKDAVFDEPRAREIIRKGGGVEVPQEAGPPVPVPVPARKKPGPKPGQKVTTVPKGTVSK